jgi:hypothetical protein
MGQQIKRNTIKKINPIILLILNKGLNFMYILCFYAPESDVEAIKSALFDLGAGKLGCYDSCSWQTSGTGQFRPVEGSSPHIGKQNVITQVNEYKVELICGNNSIEKIVNKLIEVHPYEEPAYHIIKVYTLSDL